MLYESSEQINESVAPDTRDVSWMSRANSHPPPGKRGPEHRLECLPLGGWSFWQECLGWCRKRSTLRIENMWV